MKNSVTEALISRLKKLHKQKISNNEIEFLRTYYHRLSGQDYDSDKADELRSIALNHKKLGRLRKPNEFIIDIRNLGSENDNTVIYITLGDQPFVINSLLMKLNAIQHSPSRVLHPVFAVKRNADHKAVEYRKLQNSESDTAKNTFIESHTHFVVDFIPENEHANVVKSLSKVIEDINVVVRDWKRMRQKVLEQADQLESIRKGPVFAEYGEFFRWMSENHFAFMGYGEFELEKSGKSEKIILDKSSLLGSLKSAHADQLNLLEQVLPPVVFTGNAPIVFTKTRNRSSIHRSGFMDCILFDHGFESGAKRRTVSCILGFLAGSTAAIPTTEIPHLRKKTTYVLNNSALRKAGYAYKELRNILETLPREKLFHMNARSLYSLSMTLLNQERRVTRLHIHKHTCGHFYSCLVYVPKDLFNSQLRLKIQDFLSQQLQATEIEFDVYFSSSILTRIHYIIHVDSKRSIDIDPLELQKQVQEIARDWNDNLFEELKKVFNRDTAKSILNQYYDGFPVTYQQDYNVSDAVADMQIFNAIDQTGVQATLNPSTHQDDQYKSGQKASFRIYCPDIQIALSDVLPILENMGIRIHSGRPYLIQRSDGGTFRLLDFEVTRLDQQGFNFKDNAEEFEKTFIQCWTGSIENDGYNQLTLLAGLSWRRVNMIRAYYRYLKQIRLRYSENYIIDSLNKNPQIVKTISGLFGAQFDPRRNKSGIRKFKSEIGKQLQQVNTLDEERIIQAILDVIDATLRTNYFQPHEDGSPKPYISFKLNSHIIPRIPEPAPKYEIFVYSPRVEGVHLRGGDVARGGLRWSERPEDFRTEILGLVKAQRVKNAVIVPVGSKGGFVAKQLPESGRDDILNEVIACYRIFISSLLDLTDNISGNKIIPPTNVVRQDGDDPYLVVAADKGTATFSDIANQISEDYGFWLGDAFASGGSAGYDHKKMGITARGAWESVKRHFRELGKDIQSQPFTVVGIGDMGGDVFGNGMLLSKQIKLVAAFNHMHIFIDPDPDPASSYQERERLFNLPRSSWLDYNTKLISKGGGIFSRTDKSITLTPQIKKALGITEDALAPDDLINQILKSEIELLWNGGIGTYVKASSETHTDAQDRNNDSLRVDASMLQCKVIGEGGNLGMTQLGRIEYTRKGGLCYTDAIDNSAGVDTSDHEVNIKILLNQEMNNGNLTFKQRNSILARMEKEVTRQVLANNYLQTQILSIEAENSQQLMPQQNRSMEILEESGLLNREIEFLPDSVTLQDRFENKKYLTRPELAVLLSYSKMDLYQKMLNSAFPEEKYLEAEIDHYFPSLMIQKYQKQIRKHRLRREIIATQVTNDLIGTMGCSFHLRMVELTGKSIHAICCAYIAAREILENRQVNEKIQQLDNKVDARLQMKCLDYTAETLESSVVWILNNLPSPIKIDQIVKQFKKSVMLLMDNIEDISTASMTAQFEEIHTSLSKQKIPVPLAKQLGKRKVLSNGLDIVEIAEQTGKPISQTGAVYFGVAENLGIEWLENNISNLNADNIWHQRASFSLANELRSHHSRIVTRVLSSKSGKSAMQQLESWCQTSKTSIKSMNEKIGLLKQEQKVDFSMLSVLVSELNNFK